MVFLIGLACMAAGIAGLALLAWVIQFSVRNGIRRSGLIPLVGCMRLSVLKPVILNVCPLMDCVRSMVMALSRICGSSWMIALRRVRGRR